MADRSTSAPWVPADEQVVWRFKPSPWYIVLRPLGWLAVLGAAAVGSLLAPWPAWTGDSGLVPALLFGITFLLVLAWFALEWCTTDYLLTERRVVAAWGVLRRAAVEAPLPRVQNLAMHRSIRERLFGLGTLGLATAGTDRVEVVWVMIARPLERLRSLQERIPAPISAPRVMPPRNHSIPVIGLAGGIGSGKSRVAAILAELGAVVVDSDAQARAILQEPDIQATLRQWWGDEVIGPDGSTDRRAIADVVFADPSQRTRLEGLIHPRIHKARQVLREKAVAGGKRAFVIDAPLLFEAGVDRECDAVIFVDAPRDLRLERVARTRGWTEAELDRRESAQLPLAEKRRRSAAVIVNDSDDPSLRRQVAEVLDRLAPAPASP